MVCYLKKEDIARNHCRPHTHFDYPEDDRDIQNFKLKPIITIPSTLIISLHSKTEKLVFFLLYCTNIGIKIYREKLSMKG